MPLMDTRDPGPDSARAAARPSDPPAPPASSGPRLRRRNDDYFREPEPGAPPGTLVIDEAAGGARPRMVVIDYDEHHVEEKELGSIEESVAYLRDDCPGVTWVDVRGLSDRATLERMGEISSSTRSPSRTW